MTCLKSHICGAAVRICLQHIRRENRLCVLTITRRINRRRDLNIKKDFLRKYIMVYV